MKPKKSISTSEYAKKIKNIGDFRRRQDHFKYEAEKRVILSSNRFIDEDIRLRGIGVLKLQIIYQTSFDGGYMWDIREKIEKETKLYELYENILETKSVIAPGYKRLDIKSDDLIKFLERIRSIKISLKIDPINIHGLDGSYYGINIFENFRRSIKIHWWNEPQQDIVELDRMIKQYIEIFIAIDNKYDVE